MLLAFSPWICLLGLVPSWQDIHERDSVFFLENWEVAFLVVISSFRKMLLGFESLDFLEKETKDRYYPIEQAKICNLKNCDEKCLYWISNNLGKISNICYRWTNTKSSDSISILMGWFLTWKSDLRGRGCALSTFSLLVGSLNIFLCLKEKVLTWKFDLQSRGYALSACSFLLGSLDVSFSLKEKVWTWGVAFLGWKYVLCTCSLHSGFSDVFLLFNREGFYFKGLSLRERKFDFRERERVFYFLTERPLDWSQFFSFLNSTLKSPLEFHFETLLFNSPLKLGGGFSLKRNPPFILSSNIGFHLLFGFKLGPHLNWLDLKVNVDLWIVVNLRLSVDL